jgi:hypothetical protein
MISLGRQLSWSMARQVSAQDAARREQAGTCRGRGPRNHEAVLERAARNARCTGKGRLSLLYQDKQSFEIERDIYLAGVDFLDLCYISSTLCLSGNSPTSSFHWNAPPD